MNPAESPKVKIDFQISDVETRFLRKMKESVESVTHIYNAIMNYSNRSFSPMSCDGLPFVIVDGEREADTDKLKDTTLQWLLRKAFEDNIAALNESLIEAYVYIKLFKLKEQSKFKPLKDENELYEKKKEIEGVAKKASFPVLIDGIKKEAGITLEFEDEIKSFNKVRICLVHRNGIVDELDLNNKELECLELQYMECCTYVYIEGEWIKLTAENKKGMGLRTTKIPLNKAEQAILRFNKGERVEFNTTVLNSVLFVARRFAYVLFAKLPRPEGFKQPEIQDFEYKLR
jgi:hypothetical protein